MLVIVVSTYLMIGIGAAASAESWGGMYKIGLIFMWPLVFGFWLGERCDENTVRCSNQKEAKP